MSFKLHRDIKNSGHSSLFLFLLAICLMSSQLVGCADKAQEYVYSGSIMGTYYRVVVVSDKHVNVNLAEELLREMQTVNQSMSTYINDSEVNRFNRHQAQEWFALSDQLNSVLAQAMEISAKTQGAFDITVAPLVDAWGFGAKEANASPDQATIAMMADYVGYQHLQLLSGQLRKSDARTSIDLSAIAKGYAVDRVAAYLKAAGHDNFLVDIGGELKASGLNLSGEGWRVAIERPYIEGGIARVVALENIAIATSGDYRNYVTVDGKHYSHVIDPNTMQPKQHRLASVSVVDNSAALADGLATALLVMGESEAWDYAIKHQLRALLMLRGETIDGEPNIEIRLTPEFKPFLQQ